MKYYCTLFDSGYLSRGLVMYESLLDKSSEDFVLYVFAFDELTLTSLKKLDLKKMVVISLFEFEDEELLAIKNSRSTGEYCWTCTPSIIMYCIDTYNLDHCIYLDADLYFFSCPSILLDEMKDSSVSLIPHRYTPEYDQSELSGIYCVQFMFFKADAAGMTALKWWRNSCIEWCFARRENGKFGDQKYLDDWTERFQGVHVLKNLGGGVAPWNIQQYRRLDSLYFEEISTGEKFYLVFYHYHNLKFYSKNELYLGGYKIQSWVVNYIYKPYVESLLEIHTTLNERFGFDGNYYIRFHKSFMNFLRLMKRKLFGGRNVYKSSFFKVKK